MGLTSKKTGSHSSKTHTNHPPLSLHPFHANLFPLDQEAHFCCDIDFIFIHSNQNLLFQNKIRKIAAMTSWVDR